VKLKYLLFLLFVCSSCNRTKQVTVTEISKSEPVVEDSYTYYPIKDNRINVDLDKSQKASLFDYFSHIELIPLETSDDVLIGYCEEIVYYQNRYYIFDRKQLSVQVFDDAGKFIFQIDKRGQGPGEYTDLTSMILNPFTGNIDLTGMGFIYSYDLTGKHVKTFLRPENQTNYYWNFIAINANMYVCFVGFRGEFDSYKINYYDVRENKMIRKEYEEDEHLNNFFHIPTSHTSFYEYRGKYFFYRLVDNTTYEVGADSLIKAYTWDFGKYNYDAKNLNLPNDPWSITTLSYRIDVQGQNNRYLLANILLVDNKGVYLIHDKSTNECKYIEHFTEPVDFIPRKVTNEYVLSWCEHGALENYISEEMLDETNRQRFRKLLNTKEEMNPIIIKYYFK